MPFRHNSFFRFRRYSLLPAAWAVGITIFINDNVLEVTSITGVSMAPTLSPDVNETGTKDVVLWRKCNAARSLQRGDVVMFQTPHRPEYIAAKRVVALGGDTVILDSKRRPRVKIDGGSEEDDSNGNDEGGHIAARNWDAWHGKARVPWGHVWVEGDNWRSTKDSNHYGPISRSLIVGHASCVLWPWSRRGHRPWEKNINETTIIESKEPPPKSLDDLMELQRHG